MDSNLIASSKLDYSKLFWVADPFSKRAFRATVDFGQQDNLRILRGDSVPNSVVSARWKEGSAKPQDIVWSDSGDLLLSKLARKSLSPYDGWRSYPVNLLDRVGQKILGYELLSVFGRAGPIDVRRSRPRVERLPVGTLDSYEGLYFQDDRWDRRAIFLLAEPTSFVLVTNEVKEALVGAGITNIEFIRLDILRLDAPTMDVLIGHQNSDATADARKL